MGTGYIHSPIGIMKIVCEDGFLTSISLVDKEECHNSDLLVREVKLQLEEYFDRKRQKFDLPVKLCGTGFCHRVWEEIQKVEYGKTITYGELAARAGSPKAYRSAGTCTGKNPIPIVVPCHRIVASNGIGGFGLGLNNKRKLLSLEGNKDFILTKNSH